MIPIRSGIKKVNKSQVNARGAGATPLRAPAAKRASSQASMSGKDIRVKHGQTWSIIVKHGGQWWSMGPSS